jgi:tetratricopeptide (TPR) repeat protein
MMKFPLTILAVLFLSACATTHTPAEGSATAVRQQHLLQQQVARAQQELQNLAAQEQDNYVRYEQAKQLYMLAMLNADWEANKQAQAIFESLLEDKAFVRPAYRHAELRAYYGSLYTLKGRDLPGWWWVNNLTPVGMIRIYYVNKGVDELNAAVALDEQHPVVRLLRGNTFSHLPSFAGVGEEGVKDMQLLFGWLQDSGRNSRYASILQSDTFRLGAYFNIAQVFAENDKMQLARQAYGEVVRLAPKSIEAQIARAAIQHITVADKEGS